MRRSTRQKDAAERARRDERAVRSRPTGRVSRRPFQTGFCGVTALHSLCPGEIRNGRKATQPVVLCTCDCHGDIGKRRTALRDRLRNMNGEEA